MRCIALVAVIAAFSIPLLGCSSGDVGSATTEKPKSAEEVKSIQPGKDGSKAARGGGMADMEVVPARPGEKSGLPGPGAKSGG